MLLKLELLWIFYKKIFTASLLLNLSLYFLDTPFAVAILFKFLLVLFFLVGSKLKKNSSDFVFYKNLGVSTLDLVIGSLIFEFIGLVIIYKLTEFILWF